MEALRPEQGLTAPLSCDGCASFMNPSSGRSPGQGEGACVLLTGEEVCISEALIGLLQPGLKF